MRLPTYPQHCPWSVLSNLCTFATAVRNRKPVGFGRRQWQPTPVLLPGKSHGCKTDSQWGFAVRLRELKQGLCINLEGWNGEGDGKEVQEGGDICTLMADSC